jgi:hypothetical protein
MLAVGKSDAYSFGIHQCFSQRRVKSLAGRAGAQIMSSPHSLPNDPTELALIASNEEHLQEQREAAWQALNNTASTPYPRNSQTDPFSAKGVHSSPQIGVALRQGENRVLRSCRSRIG